MFAKTVIDSDAFTDMPLSAQALYFHLSMRADDDGFINNPKRIQRMIGCGDDDAKLLIAKQFIIPFDSGVVVIKHWRIHNYIQKDRYHETVYQDEKSMLITDKNKGYELMDTGCIHDVSKMDTQVRLGKDRIGKDNIYIGGADAPAVYIEPVENVDNSKLQEAINDFLVFRKEIKKPLGKKGIEWLNKRLDELAKNEDEKIAILNQSIFNGWKDLFPLREINDKVPASGSGSGTKYQYGNTRFSNYQPSEHDFAEIERQERELRLREAGVG